MASRGLCRSQGRQRRRGRVHAPGLRSRAARREAEAGAGHPDARRAGRDLASTPSSSMARRRPASTSPARSRCRRSKARNSPASRAMSPASTDDEFTAVSSQFADKVQTDDKGHADLSADLPEGAARQARSRPRSSSTSASRADARSSASSRCRCAPKATLIGVKKDFDDGLGEGEVGDVRGDRGRAGRHARRAQEASPGRSTRSTTTISGTTPTAAGATSPSSRRKRIAQRHASTSPPTRRPSSPPRRLGHASARHQVAPTATRPASPSTSAGRERPSADTPDNVVVTLDKTNYAAGDEAQAAHRLALSPARRRSPSSATRSSSSSTSTSSNGDNVVAVHGRGAIGAPAPMPSRSTHRPLDVGGQAHAGPRARPRLVRASTRPRASSTSSLDAPQMARPRQTDDAADPARRPRAGRRGATSRSRRSISASSTSPASRRRTRTTISSASASCRSRSAISTGC